MKFVSLLSILFFVLTINGWAQGVPPRQDGSLFSLEVGNLVFTVDSAYGAKVSSLTLDGTEFLITTEMVSSDYLWGATLWPSPQSEWVWDNPNKLIWDHEEYTASIDGDTMSFKGKNVSVDKGDSFYFIKNFWASSIDTTLSMHYSMVNTTGKTIKKALWELTRVPVGGLTFWPTGPGGTWGALASATEVINDYTWYDRESKDGTGLKFFADGKDGWYAHVDDFGTLLIKTFEDVNRAEFADGEGEIELWVDNEYIELENQSVCRNIANQEQLGYDVKWVISEKGTPPTSIAPNFENLSAQIYPNPTKNTIQVNLNGSSKETIRYSVIDIQGKIVKVGDLTAGHIDVSELVNGIYVLQLGTEKKIVRNKIVIE